MLEIQGLTKAFSKEQDLVLKGIDLRLEQGEFVAILGTSGAGKSTLLRCVNRLLEPSGGEIYWDGQEISTLIKKDLREYRRNVGMIFQEYNLIERLTVLTNVLFGRLGYVTHWRLLTRGFSKADHVLAQEALERVGLHGYEGMKVRNLSGGQRQRVAIARALAQKSRLILGDEPVSSLDPVTAKKVMHLLKQINQEDQITMLLSIHDVHLAKEFATRIIGINHGRIICDLKPEDLTEQMLYEIYES